MIKSLTIQLGSNRTPVVLQQTPTGEYRLLLCPVNGLSE